MAEHAQSKSKKPQENNHETWKVIKKATVLQSGNNAKL